VTRALLGRIRALAARAKPILVSDHLAMTRSPAGIDLGHLCPLLPVKETLDLVAGRLSAFQDLLAAPIALENIALPFELPGDLTEAELFTELVSRTGCGMLLDLTNLVLNARNFGFDPALRLEAYPLEAVWQVHLAGGLKIGDFWVDTHSAPVGKTELELLSQLRRRATALRAIVIERDEALPPLAMRRRGHMAVDLSSGASALRESPLVDHGLLKTAGRDEVMAAIDRWNRRGLRAHVFITERGDELGPWHELWSELRLDEKKDLLLLFNGKQWDARGWGLGRAPIHEALQQAESGLHTYFGRGLVMALDQLGAAATGTSAPLATRELPAHDASEPRGSGFGLMTAVALAVPVGALAWVLRRRKKLGEQRFAEFEKSRLLAEQTYAEVMVAAEALSDEGSEERRRAGELKDRLDLLAREAAGRPTAANDPVLLGKVEQLDNEMAALHSAILQKTKGN
jgi:uncharacterized protein (UPF0276 family)